MRVKVLFFASIKELTGEKVISFDIPANTTVRNLKIKIIETYPALKETMDSAVVSVDRNFAFDEELIPENAEIALFPPVSGGAELPALLFVEVTEDEIDLDLITQKIINDHTGAIAVFTGIVRGYTQGDQTFHTDHLVYEAYTPMAELKMRQVAAEIQSQWSAIIGVAIVQRVGRLDAGTPTIAIACSAPHRDTGVFEAARYGIDRMKQIVPIWKKEVGSEGESWVSGDYSPIPTDKEI